jgi:hypothetical protein
MGAIGASPTDNTSSIDGYLSFYTRTSASVTEKMRITAGGNVGIGTTSPTVKLDVNGAQIIRSAAGFGTDSDQAALFLSNTSNYGLSGNFAGYSRNLIKSDGASLLTIGRRDTSLIGELSIESGSSGIIKLLAGGSERMRITSAGNVGIGTTSPVSPLDVNGIISSRGTHIAQNSGTYNLIYNASNSIAMYLGGSADPGNYYDNTTHYFRSAGGGTSYAIINSGGNVGIGTTSPAANLHVATAGTTGSTSMFLISRASGYGHTLFEQTYDSTYFTAGKTLTLKNDSGTAFAHFAGNNAGTVTNFLLPSGSVGIGTTSPGYALDVIARASGEGGVRFWNNRAASSTVDSVAIHLNVSNTVGMTGGKIVVAENTNDAWPTNMQFYINSASSSYSPVEAMRITSAGNVGIGTTAPSSKLNIVGGFIRVEGTEVDQFFLEGIRTGTSTTVRIYDNSSTAYYDSYSNMIFRANQLGGSGGYIGLFGGNVGINQGAPSQRLHVTGNVRVTGAYYDSNNEAGTSGQVLSSTGTGTDWVTPATTTASSLYDLLPAARVAYNWTGQVVNDTWVDIFSAANNILTTGTWMVQMYISDWAQGGQHYTYTYTGTMQWYQETVNQAGEAAASEIYLHRMGHAANASALYLRTTEMTAASGGIGKLQIKANYSNTSNTTINFKFVKIF